jgi:hypothetical protein
MSSSNLVRAGGGLASAAAGILLLVGHLLDLGGDPELARCSDLARCLPPTSCSSSPS